MAINASISGLGYQKYGQKAMPGAQSASNTVLPECVAAAKALLSSGKAGVLPAKCYADQTIGSRCGESCRDRLKLVASGASARMVQRSGPVGDQTCLKNAMSMTPVVCKNGVPTGNAPGTAMDAATAAAGAEGGSNDQMTDGGVTGEQYPQEPDGSPWPMRIGIGLGLGALVAGALYLKFGRG